MSQTHPECVVSCIDCCSDRSLHGHGHLKIGLVPLPHQLVAAHAGTNLVLSEATPLGDTLVGIAGLRVQSTRVDDILKCSVHLTTLTTMVAIDTWWQNH